MIKWILYSLIAIVLISLEGSLTTIPLILGWIVFVSVMEISIGVFLFSFLSGIVLDAVTFHIVGASSMFFICLVLIIFLYRRKFEVKSVVFVFLATFFSSLLYQVLFGHIEIFLPALVDALFVSGLFGMIDGVIGRRKKSNALV